MGQRHRPSPESLLHARPLELAGGRSRRRLVAFSPKLGRRVTVGSYDARKLWLVLEANPLITSFCERPRRMPDAGTVLDFWVQFRSGDEEYWLLTDDDEPGPAFIDGRRLRTVPVSMLASWAVPLANWERLVAITTTWRRHRDALLEQRIVVLLGVSGTLASLGAALPEYSPQEIEAAVAHLLAAGRIISPALASDVLSEHTAFCRA